MVRPAEKSVTYESAFLSTKTSAEWRTIGRFGRGSTHLCRRGRDESDLLGAKLVADVGSSGMFSALWHLFLFVQMGRSADWIFWQCLGTVALRVIIVWLFVKLPFHELQEQLQNISV